MQSLNFHGQINLLGAQSKKKCSLKVRKHICRISWRCFILGVREHLFPFLIESAQQFNSNLHQQEGCFSSHSVLQILPPLYAWFTFTCISPCWPTKMNQACKGGRIWSTLWLLKPPFWVYSALLQPHLLHILLILLFSNLSCLPLTTLPMGIPKSQSIIMPLVTSDGGHAEFSSTSVFETTHVWHMCCQTGSNCMSTWTPSLERLLPPLHIHNTGSRLWSQQAMSNFLFL